jgi:hypothetical protein
LDAQGTRITVYLRNPDQATEAALRYEQQGDVGLFCWVEAGAAYALVGALPKERLLALAQEIYRQHPAPGAAPAPAAASKWPPPIESTRRLRGCEGPCR